MNKLDFFEKIKQTDLLILLEATGSPREFAQKLGISLRSWYDLRVLMKELDAPIAYNKHANAYYFKSRVSLNCEISWDNEN
jgi:hypothetical protein